MTDSQPRADADEARVLAHLRAELRAIKPSLGAEPAAEAHFSYELGLDSLDRIELVARVEQRYAMPIPDEDLPQLESLAAAARYVVARCATGSAAGGVAGAPAGAGAPR